MQSMSDSKSGNDTTTSSSPRTLSIKRGPGTVRQNLSHGRSNAVIVETKKRRIKRPGDSEQVFAPKNESMVAKIPDPVLQVPEPAKTAPRPVAGKNLSTSEMDARTRALEEAKVRDVAEKATAEADAQRRLEDEEVQKAAAEIWKNSKLMI